MPWKGRGQITKSLQDCRLLFEASRDLSFNPYHLHIEHNTTKMRFLDLHVLPMQTIHINFAFLQSIKLC